MAKCIVGWCSKPASAVGRCKNHYYQLKNRAPVAKVVRTWPISARIGWFTGPREANGCRLWLGGLGSDGYPKITVKKLPKRVARLILGLKRGDPRVGMHSCDTPRCVEPAHLRAGTPRENSQDRDRKGRANRQTKFSDAEIAAVRAFPRNGESLHEMATLFGMEHSYVARILKGESRPVSP
jgi:hypothetical protein